MNLSCASSTIRQYIAVIIGTAVAAFLLLAAILGSVLVVRDGNCHRKPICLGILTTGMSIAWPSPIIVKLRNGTDTPLSRPITEEEGSWIVSGGYLFSIPTIFLGGYLLDKIGRKYCIILSALSKLCTAILFIFVSEVWMLRVCRILMLIADNFALSIVPVYVTEIACKEHRGSLGTFLQIFSCLGIVITLSVGPFISFVAMNTFFAIAIAVTTIPLLFIPESPFYLYSKGREEEAIKVLSEIRETDSIITQELEDYKLSTKETKVGKIALLKNKPFLKSLALGFLICGGANLIGSNAVLFYLQTILESTGTTVKSEIASVIIGCIQLFAGICTIFITNKYNRRHILISSLSGMFFGMIGLGTFFKISESEDYIISGFMNYLPIISLLLVIYCYNAGIGSLFWLITAELFARQDRAFGVSTSVVSTVLLIFLTTKYFAQMTLVWGPAETFFFFSAMCVLVGSLIAIFLPETKGKTFNEIQVALGGKNIQLNDLDKENNMLIF